MGLVTALSNGDYVVRARFWDNGVTPDAGAVVWGSGTGGTEGTINPHNDHVVAGTLTNGGPDMVFAYDAGGTGCAQLVIGLPAENTVTLLGNPVCFFKDGFE